MNREAYDTDLSDATWTVLEPYIPLAKPGGQPRAVNIREVVNAFFYELRSGGSWRLLPHDFPVWQTVYDYFRSWRRTGHWETINNALREQLRLTMRRAATPSAASVDSQTVKTTEKGGARGDDGGKKIKGRKRHIAVDTAGFILKGVVSPADIGEREGAKVVLAEFKTTFRRLK